VLSGIFYGADNAHAVSPGSAARKCMRERRGRMRRPLFEILAPTVLSGIFTAQLMRATVISVCVAR